MRSGSRFSKAERLSLLDLDWSALQSKIFIFQRTLAGAFRKMHSYLRFDRRSDRLKVWVDQNEDGKTRASPAAKLRSESGFIHRKESRTPLQFA
jgi:hypothetical protein